MVKYNAFASRDDLLQRTNYKDVRFRFFGYEMEDKVRDAISDVCVIDSYDFRLTLDVVIDISGKSYSGMVHNIHGDGHLKVNDFITKQGDYFAEGVNQTEGVIVEQRFAEANGIEVGQQISVNFGEESFELTVEEIAFAPEHMYSMNPNTGMPERGLFAPLWYSLDDLVLREGYPLVVNELLVTLDDPSELEQSIRTISSALEDAGIPAQAVRGYDEIDYDMMTEDIGTIDEISIALGVIIMIVSSFVIYDSIVKLIGNQTTLIGVIKAIGGSSTDLIVHYVSFSLILTSLGVLTGIPLGYVIMAVSTKVFVSALGLAPIAAIFDVYSFVPSIVLALGISFLAGVVSTRRLTSISPVEAITNQTVKQSFTKRYLSEGFFDRLFRGSKYSMKIPIRNVFRRKKRTFLTAITIALAAIIIMASLGFLDSFFHQIDTFYDENIHYNMEVSFDAPIQFSEVREQLDSIQGIEYEGMVKQPLYLERNEGNFSSILYAFRSDTSMRTYNYREGSLVPGRLS